MSRREKSTQTRETILSAARQLFTEVGFDKTSMAQISQASALSVGALYLYFEDKHDIFAAAFGRSLRDARRDLELNIISAASAQ